MNDFEKLENSSYEKGRKLDYKFNDYVNFIVKGSIVFVQVVFVFLQEVFVNFIKLFSSREPKNIAGQIALVTG